MVGKGEALFKILVDLTGECAKCAEKNQVCFSSGGE